MEEKINISEILKDKPEGTKLWTDMFGEVTLYVVTDVCDAFQVKHHNKEPWFDKDGKLYKEGALCIYPSKSMRDWEKFAWKKGDVLISVDKRYEIIFDKFVDDTYMSIVGKYCMLDEGYCGTTYIGVKTFRSDYFELQTEDTAKAHYYAIEAKLGGKLNRKTLEVEKTQPKFKDGDIIKMTWGKYSAIVIFREYSNFGKGLDSHVFFNIKTKIIEYNIHGHTLQDTILRLATEEEKQQLFSALEKNGKAWDSDKKWIVDLKQKWTPKPFDRVITRGGDDSIWTANIFSHIDRYGQYVTIGCIGGYPYCIPYNEETAKLIGTTKDVEG